VRNAHVLRVSGQTAQVVPEATTTFRGDYPARDLLKTERMNTSASVLVHQYPVVRQYMTLSPFTIGPTQSLAAARQLMLEHGVRHLPVLDGGRLSGLLSERDLLLVESMPSVLPASVKVEEAMAQDVFAVGPDEPVADVAGTMIDRKIGSAVVMEDERVVGVFTTVDALQALRELLRGW
jgi:acetoin utilization protein AcuB